MRVLVTEMGRVTTFLRVLLRVTGPESYRGEFGLDWIMERVAETGEFNARVRPGDGRLCRRWKKSRNAVVAGERRGRSRGGNTAVPAVESRGWGEPSSGGIPG